MDGPGISPEHDALVRTLARRTAKDLGLKLPLQDLEAYGFEGLLQARKRFDPTRGVPFEGFAYYRIRGAIRDGMREMLPLPRRAREALQADERADLAMESAGEHAVKEPTDGHFEGGATSVDDLMGQVAASHITTAAGNADATTEDALITRLDAARLHKAIETLPERARKLLRVLYFEDRGLEATGEALEISKSQAFRLHGEVLGLLREKLA